LTRADRYAEYSPTEIAGSPSTSTKWSKEITSMKSASAILRIVFGLAVVGFAFFTYHRIIPRVEAGEAVQLFGHPVNATASQLTTAFTAIGVLGAVVIVLGILALNRRE
jgi:hypothetical protein